MNLVSVLFDTVAFSNNDSFSSPVSFPQLPPMGFYQVLHHSIRDPQLGCVEPCNFLEGYSLNLKSSSRGQLCYMFCRPDVSKELQLTSIELDVRGVRVKTWICCQRKWLAGRIDPAALTGLPQSPKALTWLRTRSTAVNCLSVWTEGPLLIEQNQLKKIKARAKN